MAGMNRLAALFPALAIAFAQNPARQSGPATAAAPGSVIRIDVNLVQVDAVVTDSKGRRVPDLQPAAFAVPAPSTICVTTPLRWGPSAPSASW